MTAHCCWRTLYLHDPLVRTVQVLVQHENNTDVRDTKYG